jgi:hypothetical protein
MNTTKTYQIEALGETYTFTSVEDANYPGMHNWVIWSDRGTMVGPGYTDEDKARSSMKGALRRLAKKGIAASGANRTATVIA